MDFPHCHSSDTYGINNKTKLGCQQYRCRQCLRQYNERTGTPFNFLQYPTDIVLLTLFYYYRFKNSLIDATEHMASRGFSISHEKVRLWSQTLGTHVDLQCRSRRRGKCGKKWHMDVTYLWIEGRWCYLYRAIDKAGHLIDVYLSDTRDNAAANTFFASCEKTTGVKPTQITTDKETAFSNAIAITLGKEVKHRHNKYMNNFIEQSHRGIKSRYSVMKGFKNSFCALKFYYIYEEI